MGRRKKDRGRSPRSGVIEESTGSRKPSAVPLRPSGSSRTPDKGTASSGPVAARMEEVRQAMERQSSKSALEKAKQLHKEVGSSESRALLIDAYVARIEGMLAKDLAAEARTLTDLVLSRFPEAAERLGALQRGLAAQAGDVSALVGPLADPDLPPDRRTEIELAVRRGLVDVRSLADCDALPADHPLRIAAAAVADAFAAVTTGDVDDAVLRLPEVSRRSPLADWKSLIRAIAQLYRGQDEDCRRFLTAIEEDSVPARVVDSVRSILSEVADEDLTPAERTLVQRVVGSRAELRAALRKLDEAFTAEDDRQVFRQIRRAVTLCERICPEMLKRLKQHISVKAAVANYLAQDVIDAFGGTSVHDAYFFRLFARAREANGEWFGACLTWNQFQEAAVREGLFAADGQENAFLYLHMADLLCHIPPAHLEELREEYIEAREYWGDLGLPDEVSPQEGPVDQRDGADLYFIYPEKLYERAAALRPDAQVYKEWLDYVRAADRPDARPDDIALRWTEAFPRDTRPLLFLAESAEQRNAFDKALRYIAQAEQIGGVDPNVRRARFRLLVSKTMRHLRQNKPHLAAKDFVQIDELPQAAEKDRPAFVASLRWVHALQEGNLDEAERLHSHLRDQLGGPVPAAILLHSTAGACRHDSRQTKDLKKWLAAYKKKDLAGAVVRVWPIGRDVDLEIVMQPKWQNLLKKWFKGSDVGLDQAGLLTVAEAALTAGWMQVAYYCTGHGLQAGGPQQARFLFLRARSLPYGLSGRRQDCFGAALALARRVRDTELVGEIVDASRRKTGPAGWLDPFAMDSTDLSEFEIDDDCIDPVIETERRLKTYPRNTPLLYFGGGPSMGQCQCPSCRRARGETGGSRSRRKASPPPDESYLFDDLFDLDDSEEEPDEPQPPGSEADVLEEQGDSIAALSGMSPAVIELMVEVVRRRGGSLPEGPEELERFVMQHPDLAIRLATIMEEEGPAAFGEPGSVEDLPPIRPRRPRGKTKNRKKRRR